MLPLARNIKRFFSLREIIIALLAVALSITAGYLVFINLQKDVVINDNGSKTVLKTMKNTVAEVLDQSGISVQPCDYISMTLDSKLQKMKVNEIDIKRAVPVNVIADGKDTTIMTYRDTVGEMLADSPVKPAGLDKLDGVSPSDKITKDMSVKIIRVVEETVTEKEAIPYETVKRANNRLDEGTEKVVRKGVEGVREKQYKVVTEDGTQVLKQLLSNTIATNPINMLLEFGTVLNHKTARGDVIRYSKVYNMRATAYTASFRDTGKHPGDPYFGITSTGMKARKGIIAVDPRVIPYGTRLYVEIAGKTPDYGICIAGDTGGAIKGDRIDLYYDDQGYVDSFGLKRCKVYILTD